MNWLTATRQSTSSITPQQLSPDFPGFRNLSTACGKVDMTSPTFSATLGQPGICLEAASKGPI
jgi:hypothetical protein